VAGVPLGICRSFRAFIVGDVDEPWVVREIRRRDVILQSVDGGHQSTVSSVTTAHYMEPHGLRDQPDELLPAGSYK
jgi:hypothetical protein